MHLVLGCHSRESGNPVSFELWPKQRRWIPGQARDDKPAKHIRISFAILLGAFLAFLAILLPAQSPAQTDPQTSKFRDAFYMSHDLRLKYATYDCLDFIVTKQEEKDWNSFFAVVTGFNHGIIETRILKDIQTIDEAREYFEKYRQPVEYQGIPIHEVTLVNKAGKLYKLYWVGHRAFATLEDAQGAVDTVKKEIEASGANFAESVRAAKEYAHSFTGAEHEAAKEPIPIKVKPNFQEEEDIFFGVYDGVNPRRFWGKYPEEEWYLYQTTFESTYRNTNLDTRTFNAEVGFWYHRIVIRGLKFFDSSIDPYIEAVIRGETTGKNFGSTVDFIAGLEYRPFRLNKRLAQSVWTDWIRNFRSYIIYNKREPIKDIIPNSRDHDIEAGFDYFKEWGIDMPKEGEADTWLWGELFMNNRFRKTDFTVDRRFQAFIFNNAGRIGIKFPRIPLPPNPVNDEFMLMPYVLFDQVSNTNHSFYFENRFFFGAGMRIMPFRSYRFLNSQWVFRTKIFAEYVGMGGVTNTKADPPSTVPDRDYRIGVNISLNRF